MYKDRSEDASRKIWAAPRLQRLGTIADVAGPGTGNNQSFGTNPKS